MERETKNPRMGLVLSGGGGKGAYEAGVFQAMEELSILPWVEAVSGCSIGSLNAMLFATGDPALWQRAWEESDFGDIAGIEASPDRLAELEERAKRAPDMEGYLRQEEPLSTLEGMKETLRRWVEPEALTKGRPRVSVCAYQLEAEEPRYFWLDQRPFSEAVELTAASCAMPVIFPTVEYRGKHYCDGGMTPPYSAKKNGDKVPLAPLAGLGLDLILVIYLDPEERVDGKTLSPGTRLIELHPSQPLGETLDFSPDSIRRRKELGLSDGRGALKGLIADRR